MLPKKLIIFTYLLFKTTQPLMASEVFYTNTIDPDSYLNFGRTIRKVDLNDNTFFKIMDNAVLCDVSNDQSLILFSPTNSFYEYSYPGDPQSFIIKNFYQYDTLNIHGHNARFTSNSDIISFTTHSFDYYDLYNNDNNAGLSSIQTYSRSGDSVTVLSDSIFYGFYLLSHDKNRILWLEKVSAEDSLEIFIHTIDNGQTNTLNAKVSTTAFFDANESNLFFWARNDLLYASLMDSNSVYCLFSIDISQNPDSFTKIFSSDTDIFMLPTQDFDHYKFLFSQKITDGIWYEKIWVHNINDESSEFEFDFFSGQSLDRYIWSADTSKIYFASSPTSWGYGGSSGPFYEYDFTSDLLTILSNTYSFSYSSSLIHFDNNVNTGPSNTELINPLQNENIELNQYNINDSTTFSWSLSQDIDNDSLSYTFCLWDRDEYYDWIYGTQLTNPFKISEQNLTDTIITLSNSYLYDIFMEAYNEDTPYFRWSVDVNDGFHILDMNYGNAYRITFNYVHTPPTINPINDQEIEEDTDPWFFVTGTFHGLISDYTLYAYSDTADFYVIDEPAVFGGGWRFELIPTQNWFGEATVTLILAEDESGLADTTSFQITVLPVNDSPEPFSLIYPTVTDTITIHTDTDETVPFTWGRSMDVDSEVIYKLTITLDYFGTSYTNEYENIADTTYGVSAYEYAILMTNLNLPQWDIDYTIEAFDGEYTIMSDDGEFVFENTSLSIENGILPKEFALHQNYPNPFNPTTQIHYDLPESEFVSIIIYDVIGRKIKSLININQEAGYRSIAWNATNDLGQPVSNGMYIYTIQAGEFRQTNKMVLLK